MAVANGIHEHASKSSMFISPEMQFNRDTLAAGIAAAPDPAIRGAFDTEMGVLGMAAGMFGSQVGYRNTYQPNYAGSGGNMMSMSGGYAGANAGNSAGGGGGMGAMGGGMAGASFGGFF